MDMADQAYGSVYRCAACGQEHNVGTTCPVADVDAEKRWSANPPILTVQQARNGLRVCLNTKRSNPKSTITPSFESVAVLLDHLDHLDRMGVKTTPEANIGKQFL